MKPNTKEWATLTKAFLRAFREVIRLSVRQLEQSKDQFALEDIPVNVPIDLWADEWWVAAVEKHLQEPLIDMIDKQVRFTLNELDFPITSEIHNAYITALAASHVQQIQSWAPNVGREIYGHITEGIANGESVPKIAKRLRSTVGSPERSVLIARTETIAATNGANMAGYRIAGVTIRKEWLATNDARTRDTHRAANTQIVDRDAPFIVGGYQADYPGDPNLPVQERANCRCTILPVRGEQGQDTT